MRTACVAIALFVISSEPVWAAGHPTPKDKSFDSIFEYTLFDQTTSDGKHPVWVYYKSGNIIARVQMPSMDMCIVTPDSEQDPGVIRSKNYDAIKKGSDRWSFALEIWKAAFARYMIVGKPTRC